MIVVEAFSLMAPEHWLGNEVPTILNCREMTKFTNEANLEMMQDVVWDLQENATFGFHWHYCWDL